MTREEYDSCRISQADPRVVAVCDKPHTQLQFTITFRYSTVQYNAVQFLFIIANIICDTRVRSVAAIIGVAGSFSEGGQPFCPAKIQTLPAKIFSCQGGAKFADSVLPC